MTVNLSSFAAPGSNVTTVLNSMIGLYGSGGIVIDIVGTVDIALQGTFKLPGNGVKLYGGGGKLVVNPVSYIGGNNYALFNTWGSSGLIMEGVEIDGGRATATVGGAIGLQILFVASGSGGTTLVNNYFHDLPNVATGESFAVMSAGGSSGFWAEKNTITGIAGSAFNICGNKAWLLYNTVDKCDWNSISVFGGIQTFITENLLTNAGKRNINVENKATQTMVTGNICTNAGQSNIGTFTAVSALSIQGNILTNGNMGGFPIGEVDFSQGPVGNGVVLGGNVYNPKAGGYKVSMDKAMSGTVIITDSQVKATDILLR